MATITQHLSSLNKRVQEKQPLQDNQRSQLWEQWLWKTDLCKTFLPHVGFNEHHLIGLLLARDSDNVGFDKTDPHSVDDIASLPDVFSLRCDLPFEQMPLTMLIDTMDSLQHNFRSTFYEITDMPDEAWGATEIFVHILFKRCGFFLANTAGNDSVLNHVPSIDIVENGRISIAIPTIRKLLDIFIIMFRHLDLYKTYEFLELTTEHLEQVEQLSVEVFRPHVFEATKDEFYKLCTFYDLPIAARLTYMHTFSGMYNCISQVAYFHDESYERKPAPKRKEHVRVPIEELPALVHMYPEVPVLFEDETPLPNSECWMLLPGRIYFMRANKAPMLASLPSKIFIFSASKK